jgi:uncharacterized OB-fold protein
MTTSKRKINSAKLCARCGKRPRLQRSYCLACNREVLAAAAKKRGYVDELAETENGEQREAREGQG